MLELETLPKASSPIPIQCTFDERWLALPKVVVDVVGFESFAPRITRGEKNAYVYLADHSNPSARFEENVKRGIESVINAELGTAFLLYRLDRELTIDLLIERFRGMRYMQHLGDMEDWGSRVVDLARTFGSSAFFKFDEEQLAQVCSAAEFVKLDLATELVKRYPQLEGQVCGHLFRLSPQVAHLVRWYTCRALDSDEGPVRQCLILAIEMERLVANTAVRRLRLTRAGDRAGLRRSLKRVLSAKKDPVYFIDKALERVKKDVSSPMDEDFDKAREHIVAIFQKRLPK